MLTPFARRAKRATAALAAFILPVAAIAQTAQNPAPSATCWKPAELRARPGEDRITKNVATAYVPFPTAKAPPRAPLPPNLRGALRRVDLPAGIRRIALTFDLCEQPYEVTGYQGDIVDFLRDKDIAATFFAGGKWLLTHQDRAAQLMSDARFEIANHAWEHRNLRLLEGRRLAAEIDGPQRAYAKIRARLAQRVCAAPPPAANPRLGANSPDLALFRFPFGACNKTALDAVNDRGLIAVQWDISAADPWRGQTADAMVKQVVARTRPGSILIFHANGRGWKTADALPRITAALAQKGYEFVTVSELLATPGARPVFTPACYDNRPGELRPLR